MKFIIIRFRCSSNRRHLYLPSSLRHSRLFAWIHFAIEAVGSLVQIASNIFSTHIVPIPDGIVSRREKSSGKWKAIVIVDIVMNGIGV